MEIKARSVRAEQAQLAHAMRGTGCSWRQVADAFVARWGLSYLQAFRLAHGLSQEQAADRYNRAWHPDRPLTGKNISYWELWPAKTGKEPPLNKLTRLAEVYECSLADLVADIGQNRDAVRARPAARQVHDVPNLGRGDDLETDEPVLRRTFAGLTSTAVLGAVLDVPGDGRELRTEPLVPVLIGHPTGRQPDRPPGIAALTAAVNSARRGYQMCQYGELIKHLPPLLAELNAASQSLDGDARRRASALSADAYHVTAGLLLKHDDHALACLAADHSMRAAQASQDPITVAASARVIVHVLTSTGHLPAAVSAASTHAARLDREVPGRTPEFLSVYGSLLLRGAIAAAHHDQRAAACELLGEADDAARQLGQDANVRWTAFGPVNADLHRVHVAVTLGDAGTAIDVARRINLTAITVTERKASLLIDAARAFLQWGRHEHACTALRTAHNLARQEVAGRPAVRRLIRDLVTSSPPSVRRHAAQFASQAGVPL